MWEDIILSIISIILIILFSRRIYREYKKSDNYLQVLIIALCFSAFITFIMYILDLYNIPTKIGLVNLNYDKWFSFILTGISSFMATMISVTFVTINTDKQLKQQKVNNYEKEVNDNKPYFIYDFGLGIINDELRKNKKEVKLKTNTYSFGALRIVLNNVGVGNAKNIRIKIKNPKVIFDDKFVNNYESFLAKNQQACLDVTGLKYGKTRIDITYEDIKGNRYQQNLIVYPVNTKLKQRNVYDSSILGLDDSKTVIEPPELINKRDLS